jgi:hypothetical protein
VDISILAGLLVAVVAAGVVIHLTCLVVIWLVVIHEADIYKLIDRNKNEDVH